MQLSYCQIFQTLANIIKMKKHLVIQNIFCYFNKIFCHQHHDKIQFVIMWQSPSLIWLSETKKFPKNLIVFFYQQVVKIKGSLAPMTTFIVPLGLKIINAMWIKVICCNIADCLATTVKITIIKSTSNVIFASLFLGASNWLKAFLKTLKVIYLRNNFLPHFLPLLKCILLKWIQVWIYFANRCTLQQPRLSAKKCR